MNIIKLNQLTAMASAAAALLPLAVTAIDAVEAACPSAAADAKLEAVKGVVCATVTAAGQAQEAFDSLWPSLSGAVAALHALRASVTTPAAAAAQAATAAPAPAAAA